MAASAAAGVDRHVQVTLRVHDTGIGIAPDQLAEIFESFRQLETGLSRNHGGLGLGLAVAQKLIALLDGSISVDSELGKGSAFTVTLPFKLPMDAAHAGPEVKKSRGRVLVVDDNAIAQTIASHALRRQSFEVECAGDGRLALQAASRSRFDVILMDLQSGRVAQLPVRESRVLYPSRSVLLPVEQFLEQIHDVASSRERISFSLSGDRLS